MDDQGHGTHVAGIIGSNGIIKGIAPNVTIMPIKVLNSQGSGSYSDIIAGMEYALDPNSNGDFSDRVDIVSMSLGGEGSPDDEMSKMVDFLSENGVTTIVAAGNNGPFDASIGSPGNARSAITVGASCKPSQIGVDSRCDEQIADFSSRGPTLIGSIKPDVIAPGVEICSAQSSQDTIWNTYHEFRSKDIHCIDTNHISISGTSMATPVVSGVVALLKQKNKSYTPQIIKSILMQTSTDLNFNLNSQGSGQIDAYNAYNSNFYIDSPNINFENSSEEILEKNITFYNILNSTTYLNITVDNFVNELEENLTIGVLNETQITINANQNKTINLKINSSHIEGLILGKLLIKTNNNLTQKIIPISFSKYSTINLELNDDIYNTNLPGANVFVLRNDIASFTEMTKIDTLKYSVKTISGNLTIFVYGYDSVNEYYYYLLKDVNLNLSETKNITIDLSQSREYIVKAKSFENKTLDLYQFSINMQFYSNSNLMLGSSSYSSYGIGDQKIRISNKEENSNIDNVDIFVKYEGIVN